MKQSPKHPTTAASAGCSDSATPDETICRHCARPANRHGKYLGGCMRDGKALRTTFEPIKKSGPKAAHMRIDSIRNR